MPAKMSRAICIAAALATLSPLAPLAQPAQTPRLTAPLACGTLPDASLLSRIETLFAAFGTKWLQIGEHWFQAYELPGEARNPLMPKKDRTGPVRGYTWVQFPRCIARQDQASGAWQIRITANRISFNEASGWTKAITAGILAEFVLSPGDGGWTVTDNTSAVSFRQPEDKEWKPAAADIPPRTPNPAAASKSRP